MGFFSRFAGTVTSFFQVGGPTGPAWKNNSGNLDARVAGDTAYVNVRGLDPVAAQDFVTLNYFSTNAVSAINLLLASDIIQAANYAVTYTGNYVTSETWTNQGTGNKIKDIVYTVVAGKTTQEVRSVYAANGTTVLGQVTYVYTYTGSKLTSGTVTRNV